MLILELKPGESIVLGPGIRFFALGPHTEYHGQYRLGINAPKSVPVDRLEVRATKQQRAERAARREGGAAC